MATNGPGALIVTEKGEIFNTPLGDTLLLTGWAASMVVNALVTGLIVLKILKVFLEVNKTTSVDRTLGSLSSTGGPKLRHIIFIIIESSMALFAIQLIRVVITSLFELKLQEGPSPPPSLLFTMYFVIIIHQTLNVTTKSVHFYFFCFTDDVYYLARASHQH